MSRSNVRSIVSTITLTGALGLASVALSPYESRTPAVTQDTLIAKADSGRIAGNKSAKLWVILVADFECPGCRASFEANDGMLMKDYVKTGKIQLAFMNYPIRRLHARAVDAANAAMCASVQGKLWEYHDALFATQRQWTGQPRSRFNQIADSIATATGVEIASWKSCISSGKMADLIDADEVNMSKLGIDTTPSIIVGDQIISSYIAPERLRKMIDSALVAQSGK